MRLRSVCFVASITAIAACAASKQEREAAAEAAYTAEMLGCVDRAATLAESRACRQQVRARWGVVEVARDGAADSARDGGDQ